MFRRDGRLEDSGVERDLSQEGGQAGLRLPCSSISGGLGAVGGRRRAVVFRFGGGRGALRYLYLVDSSGEGSLGDSCVSVTRRRWREGRLEGEAIVIARLGRGRRSVQFQGPFFARGVRAEAWSRSGEGWPCYIGGPQTCPTDTSHSTSAGVSRLSSLKQDRQDEQAPHRACAGACRRPRGALRAARVRCSV